MIGSPNIGKTAAREGRRRKTKRKRRTRHPSARKSGRDVAQDPDPRIKTDTIKGVVEKGSVARIDTAHVMTIRWTVTAETTEDAAIGIVTEAIEETETEGMTAIAVVMTMTMREADAETETDMIDLLDTTGAGPEIEALLQSLPLQLGRLILARVLDA